VSSVESANVLEHYDPVRAESPCLFVALQPDTLSASADDIIAWRGAGLAHNKVRRTIALGPISTGQIPKFELRDRAKESVS
jgi:hypothetical protein